MKNSDIILIILGGEIICYSPLLRLKDEFIGHPSCMRRSEVFGEDGSKQILSYKCYDYLKSTGFDVDNFLQRIPCGQCIECRLNYAKSWAVRCVCESRLYPDNYTWFVTFTYDDAHLPKPISILDRKTGRFTDFYPLQARDMQLFMKRLRKAYNGVRIYYCGEYGSRNYRPHYHAIIFNLPLVGLVVNDDFSRSRIAEVDCHDLYESSELNKFWSDKKGNLIGLVAVARFSYDTACYTARYCMKKLKGKAYKDFENDYLCFNNDTGEVIPFPREFVRMSNRPGIGAMYFKKHFGQIYSSDDLCLYFNKQVNHVRPPRYSDLLYERDVGPLDEFKKIREEVAKNQYMQQLVASGLSDLQFLAEKKARRVNQSKRLIRSL